MESDKQIVITTTIDVEVRDKGERKEDSDPIIEE